MEREKVRAYDNAYCKLRDMQFAAFEAALAVAAAIEKRSAI